MAKATAAAKKPPASALSAEDRRTEEWLNERGVPFIRLDDVPVSEFDVEASLSNQARDTPINEEHVELIAEAMRNGEVFPALVSWRGKHGLVNVAGNHRTVGASKVEDYKLSVYVVTARPAMLQLLTAEANARARHGLPETKEERLGSAVLLVMKQIASIAEAARIFSLPESDVRVKVDERKGETRADAAGILATKWAQVRGTASRKRLTAIRSNPVLRAAVDLTVAANLNPAEVSQLVTDVNQVREPDDQLRWLEIRRGDMHERIQSTALGQTPAPGKRIRTPLGILGDATRRLMEDLPSPGMLVRDVGPAERSDVAQACRDAARKLTSIADALAK